jgi:hypothetical protein
VRKSDSWQRPRKPEKSEWQNVEQNQVLPSLSKQKYFGEIDWAIYVFFIIFLEDKNTSPGESSPNPVTLWITYQAGVPDGIF